MQQKNKSTNIMFLMFVLVYSVSASIWEVPNSTIMRWVVMGGLIAIGIMRDPKHVSIFPKAYFWMVSAFVLGLAISVMRPNLVTGFERMCAFFMLLIGMYAFFSGNGNINKVQAGIRTFATVLEVLTFALTVFFFVSGQGFGSYRAIYGNKNYATPIFCTAFGCCLLLYFWEKGWIIRKIHLLAVFLSAFLVLATGSRAGLLCLLVYFIMLPFILETEQKKGVWIKRILLIITILLVVSVVARYANIPALNRILGEKDQYYSTGLSRGDTWENGITLFMLKPLLGWGSSATYYYVFINNSSGYSGWGVHSSYIMMLIDHGIVGTILLLVFFITMLKRHLIALKYLIANKRKNEARMVLMLATICISLLIDAAAEAFLFSVGNFASVCFWVSFVFIDLYLTSFFANFSMEI